MFFQVQVFPLSVRFGLVLASDLLKKLIPASDPNGRFATSLDSHLLGLLQLLQLFGLLGLLEL